MRELTIKLKMYEIPILPFLYKAFHYVKTSFRELYPFLIKLQFLINLFIENRKSKKIIIYQLSPL